MALQRYFYILTCLYLTQAEKAKQLLYQAKYGRFGLGDPFMALQRDSDNLKDNSFDESAIKAMYDNQLAQLENLIATQRKAQLKMREQLSSAEKRYHKVTVLKAHKRAGTCPWPDCKAILTCSEFNKSGGPAGHQVRIL